MNVRLLIGKGELFDGLKCDIVRFISQEKVEKRYISSHCRTTNKRGINTVVPLGSIMMYFH